MFKKIIEWVKNLFASALVEEEAQITATENKKPIESNLLDASDWTRIERAMEQDIPLTCQVIACKKGGYTVSLLDTYAFLPTSLAHVNKSHTPDKLLGKQIKVYVRSVKDRNILVSHKEFVEEAYHNVQIGNVYSAVVSKILDGRLLIYIPENELYATVAQAELSWSLGATTADYYPGQPVKVRIIKMTGIDKVRASIKQACDKNPYEKCIREYQEGDVVTGMVFNVLDYAIFVKITEGVAGFLHRSEVSWSKKNPNMKEIFKYGDMVKARICLVDTEKGRIFLSLKRMDN